MSKTGFAGLLIAALYAGFVVGKTVSKSEKGPVLSGEATKKHRGTSREDDRVHGLRSINDNLLNNLAEKERRISELENELKRLGEQSASALSSEEEKVRTMRRAAALKKGDELRCDILQRKDKVLREQAFAELAALLRSGRPEDILLGLATLGRLGGLDSDKPQDPNLCSKTLRSLWGFDKESFKALVLATFDNRDAEVRQAALKCLRLSAPKRNT